MAEKQPEEPLAVDVRGAARLLGLGRSSVLGLANSGELPRVRFGRSVRFLVDDIDRLARERRSAGSGAAPDEAAGPYRLLPPSRAE